jgi:DNA-binding CsgD family transcriptional regulator
MLRHEAAMDTAPSPTRREREVIQLACDGLANKQIASALGISIKTVEFHLTRVYARTNCVGRAHLAATAAANGWLGSGRLGPAHRPQGLAAGGWRR